ncbi:hypothetical protein OAM69_07135 [bacterium]|nr:hypothetical protein [bacterium]
MKTHPTIYALMSIAIFLTACGGGGSTEPAVDSVSDDSVVQAPADPIVADDSATASEPAATPDPVMQTDPEPVITPDPVTDPVAQPEPTVQPVVVVLDPEPESEPVASPQPTIEPEPANTPESEPTNTVEPTQPTEIPAPVSDPEPLTTAPVDPEPTEIAEVEPVLEPEQPVTEPTAPTTESPEPVTSTVEPEPIIVDEQAEEAPEPVIELSDILVNEIDQGWLCSQSPTLQTTFVFTQGGSGNAEFTSDPESAGFEVFDITWTFENDVLLVDILVEGVILTSSNLFDIVVIDSTQFNGISFSGVDTECVLVDSPF